MNGHSNLRGLALSVLGLLAALLTPLATPAPSAAQAGATRPVTFAKDVAPILQRSCQTCHRPGSIAPMSLLSYADARPWARSIKNKVSKREMPPWYIERNIGIQKFQNDPSLSDEEIATIVAWVDEGAAQGNPADMPPPRTFENDRWTLGTPDLVVTMDKDVTVPAIGPDWWPSFTVDSGLTEDRWIKAVETKPSANSQKVVHHATTSMIFPEDDDEFGAGGQLSEYAVGKNADINPEGAGRLIKAGTKIRFGMHYHSVGEEIKNRMSVAFKFYPKGVRPKYEMVRQHVGDNFDTLDIPAGVANARSDGYMVLSRPAILTGFQPHMHNRGTRMCLEAIYPDGRPETLSCAKHNFAWMLVYNYAEDVAPLLPAGTILHTIGWHDNTTANIYNPDPRNWAGFGNRSIDDMSFSWTTWMYLPEDEFKARVAERRARAPKLTTGNNN
jgi:mono/diheme cytochrome c family protein